MNLAAVSGLSASATFSGDDLINRVDQPTSDTIQQAKKIIHSLPDELYQSAHEPHGARAITGDNKVTPAQIELFRAISSLLDCPMPPLNDY